MKAASAMNQDMNHLPVRACQIECINHPEWGTFGVYEDRGDWYEIHNRAGSRVLSKAEAVTHWRRVFAAVAINTGR